MVSGGPCLRGAAMAVDYDLTRTSKEQQMPNVFVEPTKEGQYQIEFAEGRAPIGPFATQQEAIDRAKTEGHHPLVARVRHLNDKKKPDQWRSV